MTCEIDFPGSGFDQTTALQEAVNDTPAEGGQINLCGDVVFSTLDLHGRRNIRFEGKGGAGRGAGAPQRTQLFVYGGAGSAGINCHTTMNVSFHRLFIRATDAAFDGRMIDYGGTAPTAGSDSSYMSLDDCTLSAAGTACSLLSLNGATNGEFSKVTFLGNCTHIGLAIGTGFSNNHLFTSCKHQPGSVYPVNGSGEAITFQSCSSQASYTTGRAGFYTSDASLPFHGLNFIGCSFYDVSAAGGQWISALWGNGLNIVGSRFGGFAGDNAIGIGGGGIGADPQLLGCRGVNVLGNSFQGFSVAVACYGTVANKKNVRGLIVGGNSVTNGILLGNHATAEQLMTLPNSIHGSPNGFGSNLAFRGLPTYPDRTAAIAGGLATGQAYYFAQAGTFFLAIV